jgi:toxin-antitoxin system PIN domain toxin
LTTRSSPGAALLDINVLIALAWPNHVHHDQARAWFDTHHRSGWATTPVTETGFVRVSSNRAAIAVATTPEHAVTLLTAMCRLPGHRFWPDDVQLVGSEPGAITSHRAVTDAHLLALAERHHGRLVTFDRGIRTLPGNRPAGSLVVIEGS